MIKFSLLISVCTFLNIAIHAQSPHAAKLYGTTKYGGTDHKGTIFHYTPETHTIQVDYEFQIKVKGKVPKGDIVSGNNGKYYGTTTGGGANDAGVIYSWDSTTSVYTELYNFTGLEGSDARGAMVLCKEKFYGMTNMGGANNFGVIYEWDFVNNIYTKKIDMDSTNGKNPDGALTLIGNKFYGFAHDGGINNKGVLFDWDPATNIYTKRYDFSSLTGSNPVGKLSAYNNKLYAMTNLGGTNNQGVIYEWDYTSNVYTKKFDFDSIRGQHPLGDLRLYNNKFYGMTYEGGMYETPDINSRFGVLFEWNPANNVFVKKRDLGALQSGYQTSHAPLGSLTVKGTSLWGISSEGFNAVGYIFSWAPATNTWTDHFGNGGFYPETHFKHEDFYQAPGGNSYGSMLLSGNKFLCTSSANAASLFGCIFEFLTDSNQITRAVHMGAADGAYPKGSLTRLGNKLFATTFVGGDNHFGNIVEWDMHTSQFTERFAFDGYHSGGIPTSALTLYNGRLYGSRAFAASISNPPGIALNWVGNRQGSSIFSWDPVTNQFNANSENQSTLAQSAALSLQDGKFYSTGWGGSIGSIIQYDPGTDILKDTALFSSLTGDFSIYQDYFSECGLTFYNGKYYGMTPSKGFNLKGGIYEWDPITNIITSKISFDNNTGILPMGSLTLVGNVFYGVTSGIPFNFGTLFKWDPTTNIFTKKADLGSINGASSYVINPNGTLTYSGGKLYGLGYGYDLHFSLYNSNGGTNPGSSLLFPGCVFEFDPVLDTITAVQNFNYSGGLANSGVNPAFTKLLKVIPNELPLLSNAPTSHTICSNQTSVATFTISDADLDTMHFQITSSNPALIPIQNISTSFINNNYTLQYFPQANQSGITTINVIANDGYGGSVNFSFTITINAIPTVSSTSSPASGNICAGGSIMLNGTGAILYTWSGGISNSTAFIPPVRTTTYTITGTDANGCSNTNTQTVVVSPGIQPTISISSNIIEGNTGEGIIYIASINLLSPYVINWYRNNIFQTATTTNSWNTNIVSGNNAVKAIISSSSQCLQPDSVASNLVDFKSRVAGITVYPNPTTGEVIVSGLLPNDEIGLYNSIGQKIRTTTGTNIFSNQNKLQLKNISSGAYVLFIKRNEEVFAKKIIKVTNE